MRLMQQMIISLLLGFYFVICFPMDQSSCEADITRNMEGAERLPVSAAQCSVPADSWVMRLLLSAGTSCGEVTDVSDKPPRPSCPSPLAPNEYTLPDSEMHNKQHEARRYQLATRCVNFLCAIYSVGIHAENFETDCFPPALMCKMLSFLLAIFSFCLFWCHDTCYAREDQNRKMKVWRRNDGLSWGPGGEWCWLTMAQRLS